MRRPDARAAAGHGRRPGLRRRALAPGVAGQPARPGAASTSRSSSSTTARRTGRARSPTRTPPATTASRVLHVANGGLGSARNVGTEHGSTGDFLGFLDSDDVLPPGALATLARHAGRVGLRLRDRLDRPLGGRRPARAALDAPPAPRAHGRSPPASTPRSSATCSRGTSCSARRSGASRGWSGPRACRYEDQPTTTRAYLAGTFDVVPDVVYHWRIRQDGTSITQQRASVDRPDRPLADQADGPRRRAGVRRPRHVGVLRRPRAGRRPAPLLRRDPRRVRRVVAAAGRRRSATCGASVRWCTAASRRCTGSWAGWSSRTGGPTPSRSCGGS